MGLLDKAVSIANSVTQGMNFQSLVTYEAFIRSDGSGVRTYATAASIRALVEHKQRQVRASDGQLVMSLTKVTILDPTILINAFDKITLPDGSTGPILAWEGFVNPATNRPIMSEVYLG